MDIEEIKEKFNDYMEKKELDMQEREDLALSMFLEYREYNQNVDNDDDLDDLDDLDDEDDLDNDEDKKYNKQMEEEYPNFDDKPNKQKLNHSNGIKSLIKKPKIIKKKPKGHPAHSVT